MSIILLLSAALLPAILLWLYVWHQDAQPEPTRLLVKAFAYGFGLYSIYHFTDRSPRVAACILLVPMVAHGVYDALALSSTVSAAAGGISFLVLIYFCVKMNKAARKKMLAQIERDRQERFTV